MSFFTWIILGLAAGFIGSKIVNKAGKAYSSISSWELSVPLSGDGCSVLSARQG